MPGLHLHRLVVVLRLQLAAVESGMCRSPADGVSDPAFAAQLIDLAQRIIDSTDPAPRPKLAIERRKNSPAWSGRSENGSVPAGFVKAALRRSRSISKSK